MHYVAHGKIYERKAEMKVETPICFGEKWFIYKKTSGAWNNEQKFGMKGNQRKSSLNIYWLLTII